MSRLKRKLAKVTGVHDLIAYSYSLRRDNPSGMLAAAKNAVRAAELQDRADLLALALANYGNALRVNGLLLDAEDALLRARELSAHLGESVQAVVLRFLASLSIAKRTYREALALLAQSIELYRRCGDSESVAACLIKEAITLQSIGEFRRGFRSVVGALPLVGSDKDLLRAGWQTAIMCLAQDDRASEAAALVVLGRQVLAEGGEEDRRKVRWAEGLIAARMGNFEVLENLREEYAHAGRPLQAAEVALDLGRVALLLGRTPDCGRNVQMAEPILRSLGIWDPLMVLEEVAGAVRAAAIAEARLKIAAAGPAPGDQGFGLQGTPSGSMHPPL